MKSVIRNSLWLICLGAALTWMGCASDGHRQSTGDYIDSAAVTAKVKAALIDDPLVKAFDINVDTYRDVVQLNGFVESAEQKKRAEEVAMGVDGVRGVQNNLTVKSEVKPKETTTTTE